MKMIIVILLTVVVLTGLSAGLGFANLVGYMPAMKDTPPSHLLSFWQHADHYFRARMPFFGNALLLSLLVALVMMYKDWNSIAFLLIALSFVACISDLGIIVTQNLPVNKIIETLDPEKPIPSNFESLRSKAMNAYYLRAVCNLCSFAFALAGTVMYYTARIPSAIAK